MLYINHEKSKIRLKLLFLEMKLLYVEKNYSWPDGIFDGWSDGILDGWFNGYIELGYDRWYDGILDN